VRPGAVGWVAAHLPAPIRKPLGRLRRAVRRMRPRRVPRTPTLNHVAGQPAPSAPPPDPAVTEPPRSRLETRREFVFRSSDPGCRILEIGPAHNAILPKRDGFDTKVVDYLDRPGLVEKYRDFAQYSPEDIEDVDYVLPAGASMSDVIDERFQLVLASHVLEHTTSLIDFLNDCARLLAPGGVVSLVVPDHRYCFDRFRERSSIARVIDMALAPQSVHTVGTLTDFSLNAVRHRGTTSWAPGHRGTYTLVHDMDAVTANAARAAGPDYIDVHNWVFSPNHLRLLLFDLHALGYLPLREVTFQDTIGHEFFLTLSPDGPGPGLSREELLVLADEDAAARDRPVFEQRANEPEASE
jgi:SAM-dependent methyltransferase